MVKLKSNLNIVVYLVYYIAFGTRETGSNVKNVFVERGRNGTARTQ